MSVANLTHYITLIFYIIFTIKYLKTYYLHSACYNIMQLCRLAEANLILNKYLNTTATLHWQIMSKYLNPTATLHWQLPNLMPPYTGILNARYPGIFLLFLRSPCSDAKLINIDQLNIFCTFTLIFVLENI